MTEEELQEALIGALIGQPVVRDHYTLPITPRDAHLLAAPLLPIVRAYAAEELRAAADWGESRTRIAQWGLYLRARADALTASEGAS